MPRGGTARCGHAQNPNHAWYARMRQPKRTDVSHDAELGTLPVVSADDFWKHVPERFRHPLAPPGVVR